MWEIIEEHLKSFYSLSCFLELI